MRLICPRCGAQYEIDDAAIPAAGRDVECSACEHVWRASRPALPTPRDVTDPDPAGFDPAARPSLNQKLSDSVLDILREEAARELDARAAERNAARAAERTAAALVQIEAARSRPPQAIGDADAAPGEPIPHSPTQPAIPLLSAPTASIPPVTPETDPRDPRLHLPSVAAQPQPAPRAAAARRSRRRHDAGFHLALMVALIAVALYALAPRLADQGRAGEALMRWHGQVNEARDWLSDHGDRLLAQLRGS